MGRAQNAVNLALRWQWDRADGRCCRVVGSFNDFVAREIQHAAIKRLETDADLLLSDCGGHGGARKSLKRDREVGLSRFGQEEPQAMKLSHSRTVRDGLTAVRLTLTGIED